MSGLGRSKGSLPGLVVLVLVVGALFADVLFLPRDKVPSSSSYGDVHQYYTTRRDFAFGEMRAGRLPLWNPHRPDKTA